jgi:hypothetical protein
MLPNWLIPAQCASGWLRRIGAASGVLAWSPFIFKKILLTFGVEVSKSISIT